MDQVFTHHNVDQFPQLDELPPQDQAMDSFRILFPLLGAHVEPRGRVMKYRLTGTTLMDNYLQMARLIIVTHQLPLVATNDRFAVGDVVFEDQPVITYAPKNR